MNGPALDQLLDHAANLPSLPEVVTHVLQSIDDDSADAEQLAHHINTDPIIVARLLSAANSAAFGLTTRVESTRQAILILGVNRVRSIVLATALIHRFEVGDASFDARLLWRHSLGVAVCAKVIAHHAGSDPEVAFTAGLLHDIGQLLMFCAAPEAYGEALRQRQEDERTITAAEQSVFGYDHAAAGQLLAKEWRLPPSMAEAIAGHHDPDAMNSEMADIVHVAEVLSHALDLGEPPNNWVPALSDQACANLGIDWNEFARHFPEIGARYDGLAHALGL